MQSHGLGGWYYCQELLRLQSLFLLLGAMYIESKENTNEWISKSVASS